MECEEFGLEPRGLEAEALRVRDGNVEVSVELR